MNQPNTPTTTGAIRDVKSMLRSEAAQKQLAKVAAEHMRPEKMMRVIANACRTTPKLYDCEPMSLLGAMMTAAALGIESNTPQGFGWILPFKNNSKGITEAQLIIGYKGYIDLAFRSGVLTYIDAGVHYSDDDLWSYEKGMNFTLRHAEGPQKGEKLHAYAIIKWKNPTGGEGTAAAVLPWAKVMQTRDASQNWQAAVKFKTTGRNAWSTNEDAMAIKTAIRSLAQSGRMPMSVELQTAVNIDGRAADFGRVAETGDAFPMPDIGAESIEGEAVEADLTADEPDETADSADEAEKDVVEDTKKPAAKKASPKKEPTAAAQKKAEAEEKAAADQFAAARHKADAIMADLLDAGPDHYDGILAEHKDDVAMLKKEFKAIWSEVESVME